MSGEIGSCFAATRLATAGSYNVATAGCRYLQHCKVRDLVWLNILALPREFVKTGIKFKEMIFREFCSHRHFFVKKFPGQDTKA